MPPVKPLFGTPLNRAHPLAQGLVGCWLLNENSGNKAYDSSGNGNHGTLTGFSDPATATSGWCAGPHGGALAFDGLNDFINVGDKSILNIVDEVTIDTVITPSSAHSRYYTIVSKGNALNFPGAGYAFCIVSSTHRIAWYENDATHAYADGIINDNIATHMCIVRRNGFSWIYVNGILATGFPVACTTNNLQNSSSFFIGSDVFNYHLLQGAMSYVRQYNRALSPSEVSILNADPYCMFEQDDDLAMYQNHVPAIQAHNRRLIA